MAASSRYAPEQPPQFPAVSTAVAASAPVAAAVVPQGIADFSTSVSSSPFPLVGDDAHGRRRQEVQQIDRGGLLLRNTQNEPS